MELVYSGTRPPVEQLFPGGSFDPAFYEELLRTSGLDSAGRFLVCVCIGIRPDYAKAFRDADFTGWSMLNLRIYDDASRELRSRGLGIEISRDIYDVCILCAFPEESRGNYAERYIRPLRETLEARFGAPLLAALSLPVDKPERIDAAAFGARYAYGLYFFHQIPLIDLRSETGGIRSSVEEEYRDALEDTVRAIMIRDSRALDGIDRVMEVIARFHYGNQTGVQVFTMEFAGDLAFRLRLVRILGDEFFRLQDRLQTQVVQAMTFPEMKAAVRRHYATVLQYYYQHNRPKGKLMIEEVKDYIREHYMEELSIRQLANIACVSPDYFSHLFKNETRQNYKEFLVSVRLQHATRLLLETDDRVSEVAEKVGYNSTRTFVDAFKKEYSISPMEYRRRHKP